MFKSKHLITFLNQNWELVKKHKMRVVPNINEFIFLDNSYHRVMLVVHRINKNDDIFVVIQKISEKNEEIS